MGLNPGDRVIHPGCPDWGPGEVLPGSNDSKVRVYFVYAGEKVLKDVRLEIATGDAAAHPLLQNRRSVPPREGIERLTMPQAIDKFLRIFPQGFADPQYLSRERDYKLTAHMLMKELLNRPALDQLLRANDYPEVVARALRVVNATNLIFPQEKMALRDGLRDPSAPPAFTTRLQDLLYSKAGLQHRFETWSSFLMDINAAKWTNASYFQFLAFPEEFVFFKPTVTQDAADVCNFELNYRPDLNWLTYRSVQSFAKCLRHEIASLHPRDMIDVQSFIWCVAPGKYE